MTLSPISFLVPLTWSGEEWTSTPTTWLAADGSSTVDPEVAVRFVFRAAPTGRDALAIERRLDDVNGGIGETVDLDIAIENLYRSMRIRFELALWPEGKPAATTPEEAAEQEIALDARYRSAENQRDRAVLDRMHALRDRQRVVAEWAVLILDPPEGWADLADRATMHVELIARAYLRARAGLATDPGK